MSAQMLNFPRQMKRGPKRRTGTKAMIHRFPSPLTGDDLNARWAWIRSRYERWEQEETQGAFVNPKDWQIPLMVCREFASSDGEEFTESVMRKEISGFVAVVDKRVKVKDWLERIGIDWDNCPSREDALFFLFDKFANPVPPSAA